MKIGNMLFVNKLLSLISLFLATMLGAGCNLVGGAFEQEPQDLQHSISAEAKSLIKQAYTGMDPSKLRDYHTHILGMNPQN